MKLHGENSYTFNYVKKTTNKFNAKDVLVWASHAGSNGDNKDTNDEKWPAVPTTISDDMINKKEAIEIVENGQGYDANKLNATDAASLKGMIAGSETNGGADKMYIVKSLTRALSGVKENDVTLKYTIELKLD